MSEHRSIFISYRREDSIDVCGRIYDRLVPKFGQDRIFKDVDNIPLGVNFRKYIDQAVSQCYVLLVIIGRGWLHVQDAKGKRRLENPRDFVRLEIEAALKRDIPVIPLFVNGAEMPAASELPVSLQELTERNGIDVRPDPDFHRDMDRLIGGIEKLFSFQDSPSVIPTIYTLPTPPTPEVPSLEFEVVTVNALGQEVERKKGRAEYQREDLGSGVMLDLVKIPGGQFLMGSPNTESDRDIHEGPQHSVKVASFLIGQYPVTQAQWKVVSALPKVNRDLQPEPASFKGDDLPVEQVSWFEAVEFCDRLSRHTSRHYRLPSEAEWEYACRAGTNTPFHFGPTITTDLANYRGKVTYQAGPKGKHRNTTTSVGSFEVVNAFGLYDMHGNVWEWCLDDWHDNYEEAPTDGSAWLNKNLNNNDSRKPLRGGSWYLIPKLCRSASRVSYQVGGRDYTLGFRLVCSVARNLQ